MAAYMACGEFGNAQQVFRLGLYDKNQRQMGYYVMLAAAGCVLDSDFLNVVQEHPDEPLAQFLSLHTSEVLRQHASQWAINSVQWRDPLLKHLATTHALFQRWQSKQIDKWSRERLAKELELAFEYVRDNKDSAFGWGMLCLLQDQADAKHRNYYEQLAEHWKLSRDESGLDYVARYEQARCLSEAGKEKQARDCFTRLYNETLKEGYLPAIDSQFRKVLLSGPPGADWSSLQQQTAKKLIADGTAPPCSHWPGNAGNSTMLRRPTSL